MTSDAGSDGRSTRPARFRGAEEMTGKARISVSFDLLAARIPGWRNRPVGWRHTPGSGMGLVLCHSLILGWTDASLQRASSIFICQSTPRCVLLMSDDQALVSARRVEASPKR